MPERLVNLMRGKSILLLGFGKEGRSSLSFMLKNLPEAEIGIADQNEIADAEQWLKRKSSLKFYCGEKYLDFVRDYDLVLKSPGIRLTQQVLSNGNMSSQTDLFLQAYGHQTIGITGTKGKSTTAGLTHHLLQSLGENALLVGNIGLPCFEVVSQIGDKSLIVYELSANQLQIVSSSPHIAVILNIYEEHLDHFGSYANYKQAKANIFRYAGRNDCLITSKAVLQKLGRTASINPQIVEFTAIPDEITMEIKGLHNRQNAGAAVSALVAAGMDPQMIFRKLPGFKGLPHRLEYLGEKGGISFYNDSIATVPEATIAALQTLGKVDFLILGGYDRGIRYDSLLDYLRSKPVPFVFLTGKAGARMGKALEGAKEMNLHYFEELREVMAMVFARAGKKAICLLSPAAASYDRYKNFEHRGDLFRALFHALQIA